MSDKATPPAPKFSNRNCDTASGFCACGGFHEPDEQIMEVLMDWREHLPDGSRMNKAQLYCGLGVLLTIHINERFSSINSAPAAEQMWDAMRELIHAAEFAGIPDRNEHKAVGDALVVARAAIAEYEKSKVSGS